jgi:hypothetical protein
MANLTQQIGYFSVTDGGINDDVLSPIHKQPPWNALASIIPPFSGAG